MGVIYDIICAGSATIDLFIHTKADLIKVMKHGEPEEMLAYPAGGKILIDTVHEEIGGGGTNTAVGFSRMGFKTAYFGALAEDDNSEKIIDLLKKENVEFIGVRKKGKTNFSVILDSQHDDRTILAHKDVSEKLDRSDVKNLDARWIYCSTMQGKAFRAMEEIFSKGKDNGAMIAFNASSYLTKLGINKIKSLLKYVDVFILNLDEAKKLFSYHYDIDKLLKKLSEYVKIPVITDGGNGASTLFKDHIYHVPAKKGLKIIETTGAGDSFSVGFISGLMLQQGIENALKLGVLNSESVITHIGAKNLLLSKSKGLAKLKSDKRHVLVKKL